jgi:hypothetical protein
MRLKQKITKVPTSVRYREVSAWTLGIFSLLFYNWWVLVPFKPGLMTSFNELFSDLEIDGRPYSVAMQHADLASGLLLLIALLIIGSRKLIKNFKEWLALVFFAVGGAIGGIFSESCSDTTSAVCRHLEVRFQLPAHHYLHIASGIVEFGSITIALYLARKRTRNQKTQASRAYNILAKSALIGYPLLILAYLTNIFGGFIEMFFFLAFTMIVIVQLWERTSALEKK